ncbi:MAG TPA: plastocyanin/azurin family copper-binding protein [Patescibacteria group bacterium]|nr:plastocyanin/azurin family copper-binding protein [Patescibacteria group bacterium]
MNKLIIWLFIIVAVVFGAVIFYNYQNDYKNNNSSPVDIGDINQPADQNTDVPASNINFNNNTNQSPADNNGQFGVKVFDISGRNFVFSMEEIIVNVGDTVRINFTSESGFHDWVVDKFNAATNQVNTGDSTSVEFVADTAGVFEYYCSVGNHRAQGMFGQLIVQ